MSEETASRMSEVRERSRQSALSALDAKAALRDKAEQLGWGETADRSGMFPEKVRDLLRYDGDPTIRQLAKIANAVECRVEIKLIEGATHE